ncbi:hypothetical protein Dvina_38235 [Dactylosporangium vinaceum]|uniref:GH26 domain-containing protein n=1 Tax=Dactylosporangium vinaceum TaxID=53362 RepID=A0ABV5MKY8_9ACTN|nr:hypothetical protein [Dactylosporangium vinaceum]UAB93992.1 hypothetical protein Dvina_38235 [Dactylosporangium vinaceum]
MRLRSWLAATSVLAAGVGGAIAVQFSASAATSTIEDTSTTGVAFAGTWAACSGNCAKAADNSFKWTSTAGSSVTVSFTGNQIKLFGMTEPWDNIATVAIDNGATTDVDFYTPAVSATTVQVYSSPALTQGSHTLKLTMTSRRNPASSGGSSITFDKAVVTSATTTPPPATTYVSGLPWNSGVGPQDQSTARVTDFVNLRGAPVDNVVLFPARDNWSVMSAGWDIASGLPSGFNAAKQDLVATVPLWPGDRSVGSTGSQADWQGLANRIKAVDANAYVRLGWEMNLPGWHWKVGDGTKNDYDGNLIPDNRAQWQAAFIQAAQWIKAAAPGLRIVWNPNYGADQTCTNCTRTIFQNVKQYVDVYAIDTYDAWNPDLGTAGTSEHIARLTDTMNYAAANNKKWAIPEWGLGCNTSGCQWAGHAGGDNPQYIHDYLTFFKNNSANLAFESYFDEPGSYIRSALSVTPIGPNAPAKYRADITAYKV